MKLLSQPSIESWRDENYKKLALNSNDYIATALEEGLLDGQEIIKQGVIADGDSSIVYYIETKDNRYIIKFTPWKGDLMSRKMIFKEWNKQGVKTPTIYKVRLADEKIPYELALIEFIDAEPLSKIYSKRELFDKGYYNTLGTTLAKMHKAKGKGFREIISPEKLVGKYKTLSEELDYDIKEKRLDKLIQEKHLSKGIEEQYYKARDILEKDLKGDLPSLCHNDFLPYNIMATDPITVFDPSPSISSPIKDLGSTIGKILLKDKSYTKLAVKQMTNAYKKEYGKLNYNALNAAIYLSYIRKIPRRLISKDEDRAQQLIDLVEQGIIDYLA